MHVVSIACEESTVLLDLYTTITFVAMTTTVSKCANTTYCGSQH